MNRIILFISLFIFQNSISAQNYGKVSGTIKDKQHAIEFASVTISNAVDSLKVLHFEASDSLGHFAFTNLAEGTYVLKVRLVGYKTIAQNFILSKLKSELQFNNLELVTDNIILNEVVVTAQKKMIEKTSEGFVVNAANNITQVGGTATDLLKVTPTVSVDNDGVITLRGKTPLILINGRSSKLSNTDQIPASSIESIEIINNGSSKYDANAESGIINIKLKKNKSTGTNGAIALGGGMGSRGRVNSSLILNHKAGKFNFGLGYDNRFAGRTRKIESNRTNFNIADSYSIIQNRNDKRVEQLQNLKFNVDYTPNEFNSFSFEAIGNMEGQDNDEDLLSKISNQNKSFTSANDRHSFEYERVQVGEFALNYARTYKDSKKTLNASLTNSIDNGRQNTDILTQNLNKDLSNLGTLQAQRTHNYETGIISNAIVDYYVPTSQNGVFETGYKGVFRSINTDYLTADKVNNAYVNNTIASNTFNFNEQVQALYAQYHDAFGGTANEPNWNYALGLRAEQVNNNGETITQSTRFTNSYLKLFPTANFAYLINQNESLRISYGKRINRPNLGQLNPFVDITDILSPHSGNPNLKPEIIDAYELSYNKGINKYTTTTSLFYRHSTNSIRSFYTQQASGAILNMPMNIGNTDNYGIESMLIGKPFKFYDFNLSATLFQQKINASNIIDDAVQSSMNWNGKLINNFNLNKGSKIQIIGNYISPKTTPQGEMFALYNVDLAFQQKLGKSNFKMNFIIVDAFNTLKSGYNSYTNLFSIYRAQKSDTRAFMITLAYSFKAALKEKMLENKFSSEY